MKRKKKKEGFCYVHMTDQELMLYSPDFYSAREEAEQQLIQDCYDIAEHNGFTKDQLFMPGISEIKKKIYFIWDHWLEIVSEAEEEYYGPDNEEGTSTDN